MLSAWPEATALLSVDIDEDVAGARVFAEAIIKNRLELSIGTHLTAQSLITMAGSGTISGSAHWAWGDTIGYINFAPTVGPIVVTSAALAGHAWSPVTGWINLLPTLSGVTNTCDGQLGGSAWSEHRGFIDFSGVRIDGNGVFHGRATFSGSGAISFDGAAFATTTTWRPDCSDDTSLSFTSPINNATLLTRTPTISGANANFGARVYVTASNGAACNAAAGIGGTWSCTLSPALSPGQLVLSATMVALSGQATGTKTIQIIAP